MSSSRFESRYDLRSLVDIVAHVARAADANEPERVSQSRYDAARAQAGYGDAPSARQTAARFKMPWSELLALALSGRNVEKALGYRFGEDEDDLLGEADVRVALRAVAFRLHRKTLSRVEYIEERERMLASARRHWLHESPLTLPSANQIERVAGDWEAALQAAGLGPRPVPVKRPGMAPLDVLELALEAHGALPSGRFELARFAAANQIALSRFERGKVWPDYIAELRERRAEWGKWTPTAAPAPDNRPDFSKPIALPPDTPARQKKRWTREECLVALTGLLAELPASQRLTLRVYQQKSRGRPELPALGSLQRHGSFTELVAEARRVRDTRN
jgi:hypothetical protein